jgi:hypothetical protein
VFPGNPQAFLGVGNTKMARGAVAEENLLELVHPGIRKHQGRVIFQDHRGRWDNMVVFGREEIKEGLTDLTGIHIILINSILTIFNKTVS